MISNETKYNIKPITPISNFNSKRKSNVEYRIEKVALVTGMSLHFIKKVVGSKKVLNSEDVITLLEQDSFAETFVPRSKILDYLEEDAHNEPKEDSTESIIEGLHQGNSKELLKRIPEGHVQCVVTSTPYWATRIYEDSTPIRWADGEFCSFGLEQTPEASSAILLKYLVFSTPSYQMMVLFGGISWTPIIQELKLGVMQQKHYVLCKDLIRESGPSIHLRGIPQDIPI